jgi:hypothetical protein
MKKKFLRVYRFAVRDAEKKAHGQLRVSFSGWTNDARANAKINKTLENFELSMTLNVPVSESLRGRRINKKKLPTS